MKLFFLTLALLTALLATATQAHFAMHGPPEPDREPDPIEAALLAAMDRGVPSGWVVQTAWLESRFNDRLIGSVGEVSMWQLHPRWNPGVADMTPNQRALRAVDLLARYQTEFRGDWQLVRLAYQSPAAARATSRRRR